MNLIAYLRDSSNNRHPLALPSPRQRRAIRRRYDLAGILAGLASSHDPASRRRPHGRIGLAPGPLGNAATASWNIGPIGPAVGLPAWQWAHRRPPAPRLNSIWLPAGTARLGIGLFVVPADSLEALESGPVDVIVELLGPDETESETLLARLRPVALLRLAELGLFLGTGPGNAWHGASVTFGNASSWRELFDACEAASGKSVDDPDGLIAAADAAYPPQPDAVAGTWHVGAALEAIASQVGAIPRVDAMGDVELVRYGKAGPEADWSRVFDTNLLQLIRRPKAVEAIFPVYVQGLPDPHGRTVIRRAAASDWPDDGLRVVLWESARAPRPGSPESTAPLDALAARHVRWIEDLQSADPRIGRAVGVPTASAAFDWLWLQFDPAPRLTIRALSLDAYPIEHWHAAGVERTTTTTTTPPPPCSGWCTWTWSADDLRWTISASNCPTGCYCYPPDYCGDTDGQTHKGPCTGAPGPEPDCTTTPEPPCEGTCRWRWNGTRWILDVGCPPAAGCDCRYPERCGETDGELLLSICTFDAGTEPDCTTTTPEPPSCSGTCRWEWAGETWILISEDCGDGCDCPAPPFCGEYLGDCYFTDCALGPVRPLPLCTEPTTTSAPSTTTTTTTTPPECAGACTWAWDPFDVGIGWILLEDTCGRGCPCATPTAAGEPCATTQTPCIVPPPPTTTTPPPPPGCAGKCVWTWLNGDWAKISHGCAADYCSCDKPDWTGADCDKAETPCWSPVDRTTTPAPGCEARCRWRWNGTWWDLLDTNICGEGCDCVEPPFSGRDTCELAMTLCGPTTTTTSTTPGPTSTTTTTTSTSTTTTSTTPPPCDGCDWIGRDVGGFVYWSLDRNGCEGCGPCAPPAWAATTGATASTPCGPTTTTPEPPCSGQCEWRAVRAESTFGLDAYLWVPAFIFSPCNRHGCGCAPPDDPPSRWDYEFNVPRFTPCEPYVTTTPATTTTTTTTSTTTSTTTPAPSTTTTTTSTTSTTTSDPCAAQANCVWYWNDSYQQWELYEDYCTGDCSCLTPPEGTGYPDEYRSAPCEYY
ncbi:hypothetical protein JCM19992_16230 [Thermostilla marina]